MDEVVADNAEHFVALGVEIGRRQAQADVGAIRAEARREALRDAIEALRAERDHWYQVATCGQPGPTLRERALAKIDGLTDGIERIEALMPKEGT